MVKVRDIALILGGAGLGAAVDELVRFITAPKEPRWMTDLINNSVVEADGKDIRGHRKVFYRAKEWPVFEGRKYEADVCIVGFEDAYPESRDFMDVIFSLGYVPELRKVYGFVYCKGALPKRIVILGRTLTYSPRLEPFAGFTACWYIEGRL